MTTVDELKKPIRDDLIEEDFRAWFLSETGMPYAHAVKNGVWGIELLRRAYFCRLQGLHSALGVV